MGKRFGIVAFVMATFLLSSCTNKTENAVLKLPAEPVVEKRVSFYGAGDNLIHNCVYWQADKNAPGSDYDFLPMYEMVAEEIQAAEYSGAGIQNAGGRL